MNLYLLSIVQPSEIPPPEDELHAIMLNVEAVNRELRAADALVFTGGLEPPRKALVMRPKHGGENVTTDGLFVETKEFLGGLYIIRAADWEKALGWARKIALATTLPIEVREFQPTRNGG